MQLRSQVERRRASDGLLHAWRPSVAYAFATVPHMRGTGFHPVGPPRVVIHTATQHTVEQLGWVWMPTSRGVVVKMWCMARLHTVLMMAAAAGSTAAASFAAGDVMDFHLQADLGHSYSDTDSMAAVSNQGTAGTNADKSQGTGANQPTYDAVHTSFNSQAVIDFDGGDVLYSSAGTWWELASESSDACGFGIFRATNAGPGAEDIYRTRSPGSEGGWIFACNVGGSGRVYAYESGGISSILNTWTGTVQNTVHVVTWEFRGAVTTSVDTIGIVLDAGTEDTLTADLSLAIEAAVNKEFCVGGSATTTGTFTGQLAECGYGKTLLTAGEKSSHESHVNSRYNLSLSGMWA